MVRAKDIYRAFRGHGLWTQAYLRIKLRICPLRQLEIYVPRQGIIVDLGCGNGLLAVLLKLGAEERRVLGFDLDRKKVESARRLRGRWPDLDFEEADLTTMRFPACEVMTIVDVLYLIPRTKQDDILRKCYESLRPGGRLVLKEMDTRPGWKYAWNLFQETLAVKILGFTLGSRFAFRSQEDFVETLRGLGFEVEVVRLDRHYWYPHILFLCRKPASAKN